MMIVWSVEVENLVLKQACSTQLRGGSIPIRCCREAALCAAQPKQSVEKPSQNARRKKLESKCYFFAIAIDCLYDDVVTSHPV